MSDKKVLDFQKIKEQREAAKLAVETGNEEEGILALVELMKKQDELIQMLIHDVIAISDELSKQRAMSINIGSSISAITIALEQHEVITVADIQKVWDEQLRPTIEKMQQEEEEKINAVQNKIVKPQSKIFIP